MLKKSILMLGSCAIAFGGLACSKRPSPPPPETPGLYIDDASVKEGGVGTTAQLTFTVRVSPARDSDVSVDYAVQVPTDGAADLKASNDVDIAGPYSGRLSIPAGTSEITVSIPVKGDDIFERDEHLAVTLSGANGADIQRATAVGKIVNDDNAPTVSLALVSNNVATIDEKAGETRHFKVNVEGRTDLPVVFSLSFRDETPADGVATYYADYVVSEGVQRHVRHTPVRIAAEAGAPASRSLDFSLEVVNDGAVEGNETIHIAAISPVDAKLGSGSELSWTLAANDVVPAATYRKLNDTGITELVSGSDAPTTGKQDPEIGLDTAGGAKGFKFVKLGANGQPLADQNADFATNPWSCVRDEITGLVWEMRRPDNIGIHSASLYATWFDPNEATNGGDEGTRGENEDCLAENFFSKCNTATIVAETNLERYCGLTGWRMPTLEELRSIVDYGGAKPAAGNTSSANGDFFYDRKYFPGLTFSDVWTSTTYARDPAMAKAVTLLSSYNERPLAKSDKLGIWLVNDNNGLR